MTRHEELLAQYAAELSKARAMAEAWWAELLRVHQLSQNSIGFKRSELARRWPCGPASHPRVLLVIRKYWLSCDLLNQALSTAPTNADPPEPTYTLALEEDLPEQPTASFEAGGYVDPHIFISEWLSDDYEDLASFVGRLAYWPIGFDERERYT